MIILKENIVELLKNEKSKKIIYISSSLKNLDYYNYKLKKEMANVNFFKNEKNNEKEFYDINIRLIESLKSKQKEVIFIDFSLALSVFFKEIQSFSLETSKEYRHNDLEKKLQEYNYEKKYIITEQGQYAKRGDIIDIYSYNNDYPIRLDFFDYELEKIKIFELDSQKSFETLSKIKIYSNNILNRSNIITELLNKDTKIFIENREILDYVIKTMEVISTDTNNEYLYSRYNKILKNSVHLEVQLTEKRNYQSEIEVEKEKYIKKGIKYKSVSDIQKGDYVIHIEYGIGKYVGLEQLENKEYFLIQYADDGELYVPVEKLYRIEKYINLTGKEPELYKLGTRGFKRKQKKYREEIEKVAQELIKTQALRESKNGIMFLEDTVWQKEFEEKFEHLETEEQLLAINDVKRDMESPKIMDRIICGDVGYGKTEVAMRAAFKAIESGYQVALLAPTTILANQHYERFKNRFKDFPITIDTYSRLSSSKDKLNKLITNGIDLIIGTHKLLSDSVIFNNLGLLIIDEEQKFGVKDKEKIKKKKQDIDVLTLTATPIPRTLNLALLGIRDISIISTPPTQKLPIITEIIEDIKEEELVKIILKEISRDGQVYYISNNVKNMPKKCEYLRKILPKFIGVEYIHSKLGIREIKEKIKNFEEGKFQILISSTIIENGIDISNANTMIIENFTNLGLSQIYQLRGRVGRAKRQAYCYLLKNKYITEKGTKKEKSMRNIENINSGGYIIAMEDMNIRGAGEILGEKQHGAIETFGYDFYIKLLNEEIKKQKKIHNLNLENVRIDIEQKGLIPQEYMEEKERLKMYKRLSSCSSFEQLKELKDEMIDRFGKLPKQLQEFITYLSLKIYASINMIEEITQKNELYYLKTKTNMIKLSKEEMYEKIKGV